MSIQQLVGKNIKTIREVKNWSQDRLADESGLHRTYLSGVERGIRNPTIETVHRISCALEVEVAKLFESTTRTKEPDDL